MLANWPDCKLVHGKPRHSQSQGSVERANRDIQDILNTWIKSMKASKWTEGLSYVKYMTNTRYSGINRSPYEAMYGMKPKVNLALQLETNKESNTDTLHEFNPSEETCVGPRNATAC